MRFLILVRSFGGALAHEAGVTIGNPDLGQVAGTEQSSQHESVDLAGIDFGGGFSAEGITQDPKKRYANFVSAPACRLRLTETRLPSDTSKGSTISK